MTRQPPDGFIFEPAPPLTGIFECCDAQAGRYPFAKVESTEIVCTKIDVFGIFGRGGGCQISELNGKSVFVERVKIPAVTSNSVRVLCIRSSTGARDCKSHADLRKIWISNSRILAIIIALVVGFNTYLILRTDNAL